MKYNPLTRRMFLQGLGGTLAIPLLPSLLPSIAQADSAPPMRFVMMIGMMGRDITRWYPNVTDAQMQQASGVLYKNLADIQGPISYILGTEFDAVRSKMSILRGLDSLQSTGHNSWAPTTGCGGNPSSADAFGYSIDCVLEESSRFYPTQPGIGVIRSVVSADQGGKYGDFASYSYSSKNLIGEHIQAEWDVQAIYNSLFNPSNVAKGAATANRISNATNAVFNNYKQVMANRRISANDKYKLDAYMQQLSQIDTRLKAVPNACPGINVPASNSLTTNDTLHSAMIDLEVAALACGITKVVMHSLTHFESNIKNPSDAHSAAHNGASGLAPNSTVSQASIYNKWSLLRVAEMLKKLDAVNESNGTLLDNTVFIYSNEDSTGSHDHKDLPVIIAGAKSKLRGGQFIDYRPRPLVLPVQYSSTYLGRPYNQLLVTAFKALGLQEADYQKFGLKGFGRYDGISPAFASAYQPYIGSGIDNPLPYLYIG